MRIALSVVVGMAFMPLSRGVALATPLFQDGFESYAQGALDKNLAGGPNAAANGSGNPWFGPAPPNARVVGVDNGVVPHSGNQMIRGAPTAADLDQNWYNLAYRLNGGSPFTGNIALDWWFYDALGSGGTGLKDYAALGYYNTAPATTDYPGTGSLNGSTIIQRLSLGTAQNQNAGFNSQVYQARVVGAADGYASGWFNTTTPRTVGWHHGMIVVGPALADNTNQVSFYIDDMVNPTFSHNSMLNTGYNVIEFNTMFGTQTGYFDDVSIGLVPEPAGLLGIAASSILLLVRAKRTRG